MTMWSVSTVRRFVVSVFIGLGLHCHWAFLSSFFVNFSRCLLRALQASVRVREVSVNRFVSLILWWLTHSSSEWF